MNEYTNISTPPQPPLVIPDVSRCPLSIVFNEDCVQGLIRFPDKYFDLAIVDPPYGIGIDGQKQSINNKNPKANRKAHDFKGWDNSIPSAEYFAELWRVSKNQIIWGGNYFNLPPTRCFIVWDKIISEDFSLAMAELAWTSFDKLAKIYKLQVPKDGKIHPTQKPVKLYDWLLHNYAKPNDLILDTHLGSGSSRIAAYKGGFNFVGFEIDCDYFNAQEKRFNEFKSQLRLF